MTRDFDALIAYLDARARTPFAWGRNDCVSFAAGAVHAMTGRDLLAEAGHRWTTRRGALRVLGEVGGRAAAADLLLPRLAGTAFAHRGDVGLVELPDFAALVIFEGELVVGPGEVGLVRLPRQLASVAWSAGG